MFHEPHVYNIYLLKLSTIIHGVIMISEEWKLSWSEMLLAVKVRYALMLHLTNILRLYLLQ